MKSQAKSLLIIGNQSSKMGSGLAVCEELHQHLTSRGWQVYLASDRKTRIPRLIDMVATTFRYKKAYQVALVEVFSGLSFVWAEIVAAVLRKLKKTYILALYGGNLPNFSKSNPYRVSRLLSTAFQVIAPSRYLYDGMKAYREDILILRYGVDLEEFTFRLRDKPKPNLVTLRAIHKIYNPSLAPKVLAKVLPEFPFADLVMIGANKGDGTWEKTQKSIKDLGISHRVQMLGMIERVEVPLRLNTADIYLNTPNIDNTPLSITEAMSCGLCIVSTNVGGLPFMLNHETNALLVPPDDPEAMAASVLQILRDPNLARTLSTNARKEAEKYSWSTLLPKWEELFYQAGKAR